MKVQEIMTQEVRSCRADMNLAEATELMWTNDCGVLPVVDEARKVIGVITDRDICIALGTTDRRPSEVKVGEAMSKDVYTCGPNDDIRASLETVRRDKVRRLPVVDNYGTLLGILSMNDVVLHSRKPNGKTPLSFEDVVESFKAICEHQLPQKAEPRSIAARS